MDDLYRDCPTYAEHPSPIAQWIGEAYYARSMAMDEIADEVRAWLPPAIADHIAEHWRGERSCAGCAEYAREMRATLGDDESAS